MTFEALYGAAMLTAGARLMMGVMAMVIILVLIDDYNDHDGYDGNGDYTGVNGRL